MAALTGYLDESGSPDGPQHTVFCFAGYIASTAAWDIFSKNWNEVLSYYNVPYLHMREFAHHRGPFAKWKDQPDERSKFIKSLISVIKGNKLVGLGAAIRIADLKKFNEDFELQINAYSFCLYALLLELHQLYRHDDINLIIDRLDKSEAKIAGAKKLAVSDTYYPGCGQNVKISSLPSDGSCSSKTVIPVQAADFLAWELRKSHEEKDEYYSVSSNETWYHDLVKWTISKHRRWPKERQSYLALSNAADIEGCVWTYEGLCHFHHEQKK